MSDGLFARVQGLMWLLGGDDDNNVTGEDVCGASFPGFLIGVKGFARDSTFDVGLAAETFFTGRCLGEAAVDGAKNTGGRSTILGSLATLVPGFETLTKESIAPFFMPPRGARCRALVTALCLGILIASSQFSTIKGTPTLT